MSAGARSWRAGVSGIAAALGIGLLMALGLGLSTRSPSDTGAAVPLDDDRVVARLHPSGRSYPEAVRDLLGAVRADPDNAGASRRAALALIDEGRRAGDTRLVGAALGLVRPFLNAGDAEAMVIAATARQYQHDFEGALVLLDAALARAPNDAGALLMRATIKTVEGNLSPAREDCRRIGTLLRVDLLMLCQAITRTLTAEAAPVYNRLEALVAQGRIFSPPLETYALGLMGEIAMLQGWNDVARARFGEVLARDPDDLRVRMMLADQMMREGSDRDALKTLEDAVDIDGILVRRAIAAGRLGETATARTASQVLARRFGQNLKLGLTTHAREEARYYLEVSPDPDKALERAKVNWAHQREIEDVQLLLDAAAAASSPEAAVPVLRWISENEISVPTLRIPELFADVTP